jgi:predicted Zn-dependent protease
MIADVKDGVLVDGMGSFSIDQQRYNGSSAATRSGRSRTARKRGW